MKIKKVCNNYDKKLTYRELNKKLKDAYINKEYETVLLLSYSMIEDRLLSMLHHLYVLNRYEEKLLPNDYVDKILRHLLKFDLEADKKKIYKIYNISTKVKIIKKLLKKKNLNDNDYYLNDCFYILNRSDKELSSWIKRFNSWIKLRNEIIHSSFNKDINELNIKLEETSKEGYELANLIKKYVNFIKDSHTSLSVRTKWESVEKVVTKIYGYDKLNEANLSDAIDKNMFSLKYYDLDKPFDEVNAPIFNLIEIAAGIEINVDGDWAFISFLGDKFLKLDWVYFVYILGIVSLLEMKKYSKTYGWLSYYNYKYSDRFNILKKLLELHKYLTPSRQEKTKIISVAFGRVRGFEKIDENYQIYKYFFDRLPCDIFDINCKINDDKIVIEKLNNNLTELLNPNLLEYCNLDYIKKYLWQYKKNEVRYKQFIMMYFLYNLVKTKKLNKEIVIEMVKISGNLIKYLEKKFIDDEDILLEAIKEDYRSFEFANDKFKSNKNFVLKIIDYSPFALIYANDEVKDNEEIVSKVVKNNGILICCVSDRLRINKDIIIKAVNTYGGALYYADEEIRNNKEIVIKAISSSSYALEYASDRLKDDDEVVELAIKQDKSNLYYASDRLKEKYNYNEVYENNLFENLDFFEFDLQDLTFNK